MPVFRDYSQTNRTAENGLTFTPAGMAVDKVNDRLYVSNFSGNSIQVYSTTTAQLIETIN
jgi:DNA-binding beta-propeller fold protein YncE